MDNNAKFAATCASLLAAVLIAGQVAAAPNAPSPPVTRQAPAPRCGERSIILKQMNPYEEEYEFKLNVGPYSRVSIFSDLLDWTIRAVPARDPRQLCILDSSASGDMDEDFLQSPIYWKYFRPDLEAISVRSGLFDTRDKAQAALAARPGGAAQRIEVVQLNGRTFYRAIVTGFRDRAAAQAYCAGARACLIR